MAERYLFANENARQGRLGTLSRAQQVATRFSVKSPTFRTLISNSVKL